MFFQQSHPSSEKRNGCSDCLNSSNLWFLQYRRSNFCNTFFQRVSLWNPYLFIKLGLLSHTHTHTHTPCFRLHLVCVCVFLWTVDVGELVCTCLTLCMRFNEHSSCHYESTHTHIMYSWDNLLLPSINPQEQCISFNSWTTLLISWGYDGNAPLESGCDVMRLNSKYDRFKKKRKNIKEEKVLLFICLMPPEDDPSKAALRAEGRKKRCGRDDNLLCGKDKTTNITSC